MEYERTIKEFFECVQYGKLYRVTRLIGKDRYIAVRYRRHKTELRPDTSERIMLERNKEGREVNVGDFCYCDNGGTWSHMKLRLKCKEIK
jgi:hypothetical protein